MLNEFECAQAHTRFFNKKHANFDQSLDFLIFCQENRGRTEEKPGKNQQQLRKHEESPGKTLRTPFFQNCIIIINIS